MTMWRNVLAAVVVATLVRQPAQHFTIDPVPLLSVGGSDAVGPSLLSGVIGAHRLASGGIVIADCGAAELRYFDANGRFVRRAGGRGSGPGEFTGLSGGSLLVGRDDTLFVAGGQRRLSVFAPDGDHVRTLSTPQGRVFSVLPEGGFLATAEIRAYQPGDTGLFENTQAVMRWSANGAFVDTIAIIPGRQLRLRRGMAPDEGFDRPRLSIAGVGSGFVAGNRSSAEFVEYRADGTVGRRMVVPDPPMQFTPAFAVKWNEALLRAVPPVLRENVLAYTRSGRIAWEPVFPYYGAHMAATDGRLWVQDGFRGDFDPRYWLVYRNGVLEARVSLPDDFTILEAGNDWVLGFTSDRLDVQTVRMHRLVSVASPQPYRQPMRPLLADRCTFSRY